MSRIDELFRKEKETTVNISHELLTPVSVLRSKLENLLIRKSIDPEIEAKIGESLKTLNRLQSLVNSLLLIARLESRQCLHEDSISVTEVLREVMEEINPVAEDSGIELNPDFENDLQFREANRPLIFSMFYNVVNNAVKNTPRPGEIIVKTLFTGNNFTVTVSDTGKGMTEAQMSTLFSRFKTRAENNADGTGIGLAIAKSIADFHSIEILVRSEISKGTVFSFRFPENS
jgi:signal transduction histidine kinase